MAWDYSDKVKDLFMMAITDKNGSHFGTIEDPDGFGRHGSITCGDAMVFYFRVEKDEKNPLNDRIVETKYKTFGCTSAIASSEALCHMIEQKKMTPIEALKLTNQDIVDFLGGMPTQKIHCSVMGTEVLKVAVADWAKKRKVDPNALGENFHSESHAEDEGKIVCQCFGLSDTYIRRKVKELNLKNPEEITGAIKAGGGCGLCINRPDGLNNILQEIWGRNSETKAEENQVDYTGLKERIESLFKSGLPDYLNTAELVEIKNNKVYCSVVEEQKASLQNFLRETIDSSLEVIDL